MKGKNQEDDPVDDGSKSTKISEENDDVKRVESKETVSANPPNTTTGFKPLPMTEASDSWMDDDVGGGFSMEDEEDAEEPPESKPEEKKEEKPVEANPPNTSAGFKPLPMTEASDAWMNDDDVGFSMEYEDEGESVQEKEEKEKPIAANAPNTSKGFKPLPMTDASDSWMDDDVGGFYIEDEEEDEKKEKIKKVEEKPKESKEVCKEMESKIESDIDNILDEWLNAGDDDDDVPDELPDINVKYTKKNVKDIKTSKKNKVLADMSRLSNIMDDKQNKNVQNTVEDWFSGGPKKEVKNNEVINKDKKDAVVEKDVSPGVLKTPETPVGDCLVCGQQAKAICTGCKHVFYCTRNCQRKNWSSHKEDCKTLAKLPYRVSCHQIFFSEMFSYNLS